MTTSARDSELIPEKEAIEMINKGCACKFVPSDVGGKWRIENRHPDCITHGDEATRIREIKTEQQKGMRNMAQEPEPTEKLDPRGRDTKYGAEVWKGSKSELAAFTKGFEEIYSYNRDYALLLETMAWTHVKKNQDYTKTKERYSNFEFAARLAEQFDNPMDKVFATLIGIKMARMAALKKGKIPNFESIEDTQLDLSVYSSLWASYNKMKAREDEKRRGDQETSG